MNVKHIFFLPFISLAFLIPMGGCISQDIQPCEFSANLDAYNLVWADEFETEIDPAKWTFQIGDGCDLGICGWGNNELQYYTDARKNARIEDGKLVIVAVKENVGGKTHTSARMITKGKGDFKFGRIDIRAKMPIGKGLWPALWMLSSENKYGIWPISGEIDIMEYLGNQVTRSFSTVHYGDPFPNNKFRGFDYFLEDGSNFTQDFHTFSLLWKEDCIRFMVDGQLFGQAITPSSTLPFGYPFNENFYMILNIAIGGNLPGDPDGSTAFPQRLEVDYVRVYQEK